MLLTVILVVVLVFLREQRFVQGQAELAAVKTTIGALRTALVFSHLQAQTAKAGDPVAMPQRNPFLLLQFPPAGYQGEMNLAQAAIASPGSWAYDPGCGCVGYVPMNPQWLASPNGAATIWYRVSGGSGPARMDALDRYVWQGQPLQ